MTGPPEIKGVLEALVRAFAVIMNHEFADGAIQRVATHEDHPAETLGLNGKYETLRKRVHV